jgi:hypothetical protein
MDRRLFASARSLPCVAEYKAIFQDQAPRADTLECRFYQLSDVELDERFATETRLHYHNQSTTTGVAV